MGTLIAEKIVGGVGTRRKLLLAVCVLACGFSARPAGADEYDTLNLVVGGTVTFDSNVFRRPDSLGPQSEVISTGYVGLRVDKPYAQQNFFLDATVTAYRYDRFSYLDFNAQDYRAAWDWHLTPRLSGTLSADRNQRPTQFQDTAGVQSNLTINKTYAFNLDGLLFGGWHVLLGASRADRTSELASLQAQPDYHEVRGEYGAKYLFPSGSEFVAVRRRIEGDQDSQLINNVVIVSSDNYQEEQSELRATWNLSPQSILNGRVTYLDRHYDQTPQRDFSGTAGELGYAWLPTSKLTLNLSARRNIVPWQGSVSSNYRASNTLSIAPTWQATARTSVYMTLQRTYDDFPGAGNTERKDTTSMATLGLNWLPLRSLSVGASLQREQRSSDDPLVEYDATIARLSASLMF